MKKINILDCTIRDGSYAIDYNFTLKDVVVIGKNLEDLGFKFIEIGHGVGFGGSPNYGKSIASDKEYCKMASAMFKKSKWGMFFIPGIGKKEDLNTASEHGMGFVRIGTNINELEKAKDYIRYAKDLGMTVTSNLMKSYAVPPKKFADYAAIADRFGVDILYLVDSAGGMFPEQVGKYMDETKKKVSCKLGFHGHNNFSMAVANSIAAFEHGAEFVDGSLGGLGRSSGNAETEILVSAFEKLGVKTGVNMLDTFTIGQKLIKPLMKNRGGLDEMGLVCGFSEFHSSYMKIIKKYSEMYNIDPRKLILEVTKISKIYTEPKDAERIAKNIQAQKKKKPQQYKINKIAFDQLFHDHEKKQSIMKTAKKIAEDVDAISKKKGKKGIFTISFSHLGKKEIHFPFMRENEYFVIGNVEITDKNQIKDIVKGIDGIDYVFLDISNSQVDQAWVEELKFEFKKSKVITYDEVDIWVDSICNFIMLSKDKAAEKVLVVGINQISMRIITRLLNLGFDITIWDKNWKKAEKVWTALTNLYQEVPCALSYEKKLRVGVEKKDFIVGMTPKHTTLNPELIQHIDKNSVLVDGSIGSIHEDLVELCIKQGNDVRRFDMRANLSGTILTNLQIFDLINNISGKIKMEDFNVVAGGVIGSKGDVVINSIVNPSKVLGLADGKGFFLKVAKDKKPFADRIKKVQEWILKQSLEIKGDWE